MINKKKLSIFVQIGEEETNNLQGDSSLWWFVMELIRTFEITGRARKKLCEKQRRKIHGGAFHYIYRNGHFHRSSDRWKGKRIAHLRQMFLPLRGRILSLVFKISLSQVWSPMPQTQLTSSPSPRWSRTEYARWVSSYSYVSPAYMLKSAILFIFNSLYHNDIFNSDKNLLGPEMMKCTKLQICTNLVADMY